MFVENGSKTHAVCVCLRWGKKYLVEGDAADLAGLFGRRDKELIVVVLCAAELEEPLPYWDNMCFNL